MEQPDVDTLDSEAAPAASEPNEATAPESELDEALLDEQQADDEAEEELDGLKVRGKKDLIEKLKAERLMQSDYTRKTQEVAEQRKAVEAQKAQVAQQAQMAQQFVEEIAAAKALDMRLQQYAQLNWAEIEQSDPTQAMRLQREMRELQTAKEQLGNSIAQKHQQRTLYEQQETAKLVQEGNAVLQREIKGWGPEHQAKLTEFATSRGFDPHAVARITDPKVVMLLNDAMTLHQLRQRATTKPKPEAQAAPVTRLSAPKAGAVRDPDKMNAEEWVKWREAQIKRSK